MFEFFSARRAMAQVVRILTGRGPRPQPIIRRHRLNLEQLEDRVVPSSTDLNPAVNFQVSSNWGSGFQAGVTVNNDQGQALNHWQLEFDAPYQITSIWDATVQSHVGTHYVIDNAGYNSTIAIGGNVGFGFVASPGAGTLTPSGFILDWDNGSSSTGGGTTGGSSGGTTSGLSAAASYAVTSDWGSGFGASLTVKNTGTTSINGWKLEFDFPYQITTIWNAQIQSHVGNHYVLTDAGYNAAIAPGSSIAIGFNGSPGNATTAPANYVLNGVALSQGTPPPPTLTVSGAAVTEGSSQSVTASFSVTLSAPSATPVTVQYATQNGTAQAGIAYVAASGTLTFAPGQTQQTIAVTVLDDSATHPDTSDETFQVVLSSASGATLAAPRATGTIHPGSGDLANTPPVAGSVTAFTLVNQPVAVNVLASASDPDHDVLTVTAVGTAQHGAVVLNPDNTVTYTPNAGFVGSDSFTYTVGDGHGGVATGTVAVTVSTSSASAWPQRFFSPYVDMTNWPTYDFVAAAKSQGQKYFTLAFVVAGPNNEPSWGGYQAYDVAGSSFSNTMLTQINALRALGGDVMVSFGGAANQELAEVIHDVNSLANAYQTVVDTYHLTHIDFDIEGAAVADHTSIDIRSQALALLEQREAAKGNNLHVYFTLPVLPTGLTADGLYVLQSALRYGVAIGGVNIMAMDYGDAAAPNPQGQMGTYAIEAATSLFTQLQALYGSQKTDVQLWQLVGITVLIGVNDVNTEIFTQQDAQQLEAFAAQKNIGELSMWSLNRDQQSPSGVLNYDSPNYSGILQQPFDFTDIFRTFTQ